jgi:hypothetical protein
VAYARLRSMNADLNRGASEGSYKTLAPDRGGVVESSYMEMRKYADDVYHGFHEVNPKYVPGRCITVDTIDYLPTATPDMTRW